MIKSESINEIAMALSVAQGELKDVIRSKEGYGYSYADLASILEIIRPVLSRNGLSVIQTAYNPPTEVDEKNGAPSVGVETTLLHSSGQFIAEKLTMPVIYKKGMSEAQGFGVAITYIRRYAVSAMLGIAQADNDAAIVSFVTGAELKELKALIAETNSNTEKICEHCGIDTLDDLNQENFMKIKNLLERKAKTSSTAKRKTEESTDKLKAVGEALKQKRAEEKENKETKDKA